MKIYLSADFQEYAGNRETVDVEGRTVREGLAALVSLYPALKDRLWDNAEFPYAMVVLNGEALDPEKFDQPLKDGQEISIFSLIFGG